MRRETFNYWFASISFIRSYSIKLKERWRLAPINVTVSLVVPMMLCKNMSWEEKRFQSRRRNLRRGSRRGSKNTNKKNFTTKNFIHEIWAIPVFASFLFAHPFLSIYSRALLFLVWRPLFLLQGSPSSLAAGAAELGRDVKSREYWRKGRFPSTRTTTTTKRRDAMKKRESAIHPPCQVVIEPN